MKKILNKAAFGALTISLGLSGIDNPHFYRATNLFLEPRLEHNYLSTLDITIGSGSTSTGRNRNHTTVPLFDIYGPNQMLELGANLPNNDLNNPYDLILIQLALLPQRENFATLSIDGSFKIIEANIAYMQNLTKGFFLFFHLPIRSLKIDDISFTDLSPDDDIFPNKNTPQWQRFLQFFNPILAQFNLSTSPTKETGCGDFSAYVGWTHNYQNTTVLDFIDGSIMTGFLAPTGKQRNENNPFSLPLGYNGHWALPLCGMASIGAYEWITVGIYANALFFGSKNQTIHVKTSPTQSNIIKLPQEEVSIDKGTIWHTGAYFKADHFGHGLSFTAAYAYATEQKSHLKPQSQVVATSAALNSDQTFKGWSMHTLNFFAELDFTTEDSKIGPRVGFFYNYQITGKKVFKTNVAGGTFGIDIGWDM